MIYIDEKNRKILYVICLKPIKKMLKIYEGLGKITNIFVIQIQI